MKKIITITLLAFVLPLISHAQLLHNINNVATKATNIGNLVIELAISLAVVWIIVNVIRYFVVEGEESRKAGGKAILFGVIGLFVILSVWGLVYILINSFKFADNERPSLRDIKIPDPVTGQRYQ